MAEEIFLWWASGSPPCWKVMLVLEEKGLQGYKEKLLSFAKKENQSDEMKAMNPRCQVVSFICNSIISQLVLVM